jgi:hypothetical protein
MRWAFAALVGLTILAACGEPAPNPYPQEARANFERSCPPENPECVCTWERITRSLTYEEYQAALERMRNEGLMDPRVTRARTWCLEHRSE